MGGALDSPYRELKLEPPNTYSIDLRQMEAVFYEIFSKMIKMPKMHVQNIQGRHFLRKQSPCGTLHNIAKGLVPLFAAICHHLSLTIPLFAALFSYAFRHSPLFGDSHSAICGIC